MGNRRDRAGVPAGKLKAQPEFSLFLILASWPGSETKRGVFPYQPADGPTWGYTGTNPMLPTQALTSAADFRATPWACVGNGRAHDRGRLYQSELVSLGFTHCRPLTDAIGPEYVLTSNVIAFPRRGTFVMHYRGERGVIDPTRVVFHNPGDAFRTSHPGGEGDDCTWMSVSSVLLADAMRRHDPARAERNGHPFPFFHGPCGQRAFLLHRLVYQHLAGRPAPDPVFVEETAAQVLDDVLATTFRALGTRPDRSRPATVRAHADLAEAAKLILATRFRERLTIGTIAGLVHSSPYNLCRIFRAHSGMAIHEYLTQLRLRAALDQLVDSQAPLSDLALEVGFAGHSHLCDAFRRELGMTPSEARRSLISGERPPTIGAAGSNGNAST